MDSVLFSSQTLWVWKGKVGEIPAHKLIISLYPFKSYQESVYREKMGCKEVALLGAFVNHCWPIELSVMV